MYGKPNEIAPLCRHPASMGQVVDCDKLVNFPWLFGGSSSPVPWGRAPHQPLHVYDHTCFFSPRDPKMPLSPQGAPKGHETGYQRGQKVMDATAQQIAEALGESDENPRTQIAAIVQVLGSEGALALLAQTQRVEEAGGLLVPDGTRRRTPGGVFFLLAREKLSPADRQKIFSAKQQKKTPKAPAEGAAEPPRRRVYEYVPEPRPGRGSPPAGARDAGRRAGGRAPEGPAGPEARGASPAPTELKRSLRRAQARREIGVILGKIELTDQYLVLVDLFAEIQERARAAGRTLNAALEPSGEPQPETEH
jgi:hypothetical protein